MTELKLRLCISPDHAAGFGYIISLFAAHETNMEVVAAGILNTDIRTISILMSDKAYPYKMRTLRHLHSTIGVDGKYSEELASILTDLHKHNWLRNAVAHNMWVPGKRNGSIKPMKIDVRGEKIKGLGFSDKEKDYTVDDLKAIVSSLNDIGERFIGFIQSSGLGDRVKANNDAMRDPTASRPG